MKRIRLLSGLLIALLSLCSLRASAQIIIPGLNERFLPYYTQTSGNVPCKTNEGTLITHQVISENATGLPPNSVEGPTAAVKGATITVNATLWVPAPFNGTVSLTDVTYNGSGVFASMPPVSLNMNVSGARTFTIQIGPLPNYVCLGNLQVNLKTVESTENGPIEGHAGTSFKLYVVCDQPINCMSMPWVGVLEDSCAWASGKTSALDVITSISIGLFQADTFYYDGVATLTNMTQKPRMQFNLKLFLGLNRPVLCQCYDISDYTAICLYSQGRPSEVQYRDAIDPEGFVTNPGILIGQGYFSQLPWNNHQLVILLDNTIVDTTIGLLYYGQIPAIRKNQGIYWTPSAIGGLIDQLSPGAFNPQQTLVSISP